MCNSTTIHMNIKSIFMTLCDTLSDLFGWSSLNEKNESLSVDEFEEVVQENSTVLLDVRTAEEYAESHIARAIHIDMNDPKFKEKAQAVIGKHRTVAIYCRTGLKSKQAASTLANSSLDISELTRGYITWVEAGKPIVLSTSVN